MIATMPTTTKTSTAGPTPAIRHFLASFEIGDGEPGAGSMVVHLSVDATHERVTGISRIAATAGDASFGVDSMLEGAVTVTDGGDRVVVTLAGFPAARGPMVGDAGPVLLPNAELRIVLDGSWERGSATYRYRANGGAWAWVAAAPVRRIDAPVPAPPRPAPSGRTGGGIPGLDAARTRPSLLRRSGAAAWGAVVAAERAGVRWLRAGQLGAGSTVEVARWSGARR